MSFVCAVDQTRRPLAPVHPGLGRLLLTRGRAAVLRRYPFTLILKTAELGTEPTPLRVKLDPGAKTTGLAVVNDTTGQVVWAAEVTHRGEQVREHLNQRRACRHSRRQRQTRYRPARFANRRRREGWLPPSLESRIANMLTWTQRLRHSAPIGAISLELVKFDTQLLQKAELSGVEYQQGELAGYEIQEYLLEKWGRKCAYCGATDRPLQVEHIAPRVRHGSNRVSTLTLACKSCNEAKGNRTAEEFGYPQIQAQAKQPLRDAAVNATRWALYHRLTALGLPLETGTGGRTKWNRTARNLPKAHWLDAACVGSSTPATLHIRSIAPLAIRAMGRHSRQMCRTNAAGFPDKAPKASSVVGGLRTGDMVHAMAPATSTKAGLYVGRIAIRASGSCNITTAAGTVQGIHVRYCQALHRGDGYSYTKGAALPPQAFTPGIRAPKS